MARQRPKDADTKIKREKLSFQIAHSSSSSSFSARLSITHTHTHTIPAEQRTNNHHRAASASSFCMCIEKIIKIIRINRSAWALNPNPSRTTISRASSASFCFRHKRNTQSIYPILLYMSKLRFDELDFSFNLDEIPSPVVDMARVIVRSFSLSLSR